MDMTERILLLQRAAQEVTTARVKAALESWADELGNVYWRGGRGGSGPVIPEDAAPPFDVYLNPALGDLTGILTAEGELIVAGETFPNPTNAMPGGSTTGRNGWQEWRWKDGDGKEYRIQTLKEWGLVRVSGRRRMKR